MNDQDNTNTASDTLTPPPFEQIPYRGEGAYNGEDITPGLRVIGSLRDRAKLWGELARATAKFRDVPKSKPVQFRGRNGQTIRYEYATYADIRKAIDPALGEHGISVVAFPHSVSVGKEGYRVTTVLAGHGAEIWSTQVVPCLPEMDIKVLGGLDTYLRRYGVAAAVGLEGDADADDFPAEESPVGAQSPPPKPAPKSAPKPAPASKAEPAPKAEPPEEKPAKRPSTPPPNAKLWTTTQKDEIQDLGHQLGYGSNPQGFKERVREILGFTPQRNAKGSILTVDQAEALLKGLRADALAMEDSAPPPDEVFDEPDFGTTEEP